MEIAQRLRIEYRDGVWLVPSQTVRDKFYEVVYGDRCSCECDDFKLRQKWCKHIWAVHKKLEEEKALANGKQPKPVKAKKQEPEPKKPKKPTVRRDWGGVYNPSQMTRRSPSS